MKLTQNEIANVGLHPGAAAVHDDGNLFQLATPIPGDTAAPGCSPTGDKYKYPVRKQIRAEFHDYSGGDYFVTICTHEKAYFFGEIRNGEMEFSTLGLHANYELAVLSTHYNYVEVPLFVVMPNHIHAIITIRERSDTCLPGDTDAPGCIPTVRTALGVVVSGFKQNVTRYARRNNIEFGWQSRYHDHIIRSERDGNNIAEYILNNVVRWASDCFNIQKL